MDENNDNFGGPIAHEPQNSNNNVPPRPPASMPVYAPSPTSRKGRSLVGRIFRSLLTVIFILSIILNIYLLIALSSRFQESVYQTGDYRQKIALIDLEGMINMDKAQEIRKMLQRAAGDENVKAVILVVNSGGGEVAPSNMINRYVRDFSRDTRKKLYVSIQSVGASGAYWISAAAEKIYAQENAIVGSIGVIYLNLVLEDTLKEKLGITPIVIKSSRSPHKDQGSMFRQPTEEEITEIRADLDKIHRRFVAVVTEGRNINEEQAWQLANGDVFDGEEAVEKQLVDKVGFLEDVINDLAGLVKLENPRVVRYTPPPSLREMLLSYRTLSRQSNWDIYQQLEKFAKTSHILALWPGQ